MISIKSPLEIRQDLGKRFQRERLLKNFSREFLSQTSGVPAPTIRKFEDSGDISLKSMIALAHALGRIGDIDKLMKIEEPQTRQELKNINRQRGRGE